MRYKHVASCMVVGWLAGGGLFAQELVKNGNFTEGTGGLDGWTANASATVATGTTLSAPQSGHPVHLASYPPDRGQLSQTLTAGPGSKQIGFYVQGNSLSSSNLEVSLGGTVVYSRVPDSTGYEFTKISNTPSTLPANPLLKFRVTSGGFSGDVSISNITVLGSGEIAIPKEIMAPVTLTGQTTTVLIGKIVSTKGSENPPTGPRLASLASLNQDLKDLKDIKFIETKAKPAAGCNSPAKPGQVSRSKAQEAYDKANQLVNDATALLNSNTLTSAEEEEVRKILNSAFFIGNDASMFKNSIVPVNVSAGEHEGEYYMVAKFIPFIGFSNALSKVGSVISSVMVDSGAKFTEPHIRVLEHLQIATKELSNTAYDIHSSLDGELSIRHVRLKNLATQFGFAKHELSSLDLDSEDGLVAGNDLTEIVKGISLETSQITKKTLLEDKGFFIACIGRCEKAEQKLVPYLQKIESYHSIFSETALQDSIDTQEAECVASLDPSFEDLIAKRFFPTEIESKMILCSKFLKSTTSDLRKSLNIIQNLKVKAAKGLELFEVLKPHFKKILGENDIFPEEELDLEFHLAQAFEKESFLVAANNATTSARETSKGASSDSLPTAKGRPHFWTHILGQYMHQNKVHSTPSFFAGSGGTLIGADWKVSEHAVGCATGYVYSYVGQGEDSGHANLNQGVLTPYAVFRPKDWVLNLNLTGGYTHVNNHRNFTAGATKAEAIANSHSWQLAPHFDVTYTEIIQNSWFNVLPYVMGDYSASWQSSFQEKGGGIGNNISQDNSFSGFIRTEAGLVFKESIQINYGTLVLSEKGGWAYQRSFSPNGSFSLIGLQQSFVVPGSANVQNLGVIEFTMSFQPRTTSLPTVDVSYSGQFGSIYSSQVGSVNISKDF